MVGSGLEELRPRGDWDDMLDLSDRHPIQLQFTLRQVVVLRDILQWHEPRAGFEEPIDEQEVLRCVFEKLGGARPAVKDGDPPREAARPSSEQPGQTGEERDGR